jgi:hypothetical protein
MPRYVSVLTAMMFILVGSTQPAYAYLDPGTGSMLLQGLIAAIAGGLVFLKIYWQKVKILFSGAAKIESADSEPKSTHGSDETS